MNRGKPLVVTIDGPAGAGKSTLARQLAQGLGYRMLDTGALYRAVALLCSRRGVDHRDEEAVAAVARDLDVAFRFSGDVNHVFVAGEDVTEAIRAPDISDGSSRVSALPGVRAALLDLQRRLAASGGVVVEGRDTGSVVFPDAQAKFFLTASAEVRARRRFEELAARGTEVDYDTTLAEMMDRDERDSNRAIAPLVQPADAVLVDSSRLNPDQVLEVMLAEVRRRELGTA